MANSLNIIARMRLVLLRVLKACRARASAASKVIYEPVNCSALQYYPGYEPSDYQLVAKYATQKAEINADHYIDGFGVKTNFSCIAFASAAELKRENCSFRCPMMGFMPRVWNMQRYSMRSALDHSLIDLLPQKLGADGVLGLGLRGSYRKERTLRTLR